MNVAALIVAAGAGARIGGAPKQYRKIGGRPVLTRSLTPFLAEEGVQKLAVVIRHEDSDRFRALAAALPEKIDTVAGGPSRQESVRLGLESLAAHPPDIILVHDAARPFVTRQLIRRAIAAAARSGAAVPVLPLTDSVVRVEADRIESRQERDFLRTVQTPQAFDFKLLLAAHRMAASRGLQNLSDDGAVVLAAGHEVHLFDGDPANVKLTWPQDFDAAEARLSSALVAHVASGYDVHAFGPGDHVWLAGVRVAHDRSLIGHSDADAPLHALTDAVLGAASDGDIGSHFPPSDPQWRGVSSDRFLAFAANRIHARGGLIDHLDLTIVCEIPKIGPYRDAMRGRIAEIAGMAVGGVSIKATTSERLGFIGRQEGLAAFATATVRLPANPLDSL